MAYSRFLKRKIKGFTLVELLISVGIMVIMTVVLLANYPESTTKLALFNANNNLSLLIREAQIRGSAVDAVNNTLGGYGVFIDSTIPSQLVLFADLVSTTSPQGLGVGNGLYDITPDDEMKSTETLLQGYSYKKLCVGSSTAGGGVAPYGFLCNEKNDPPITSITISFTRPSTVAHVYINNSTTSEFSSACIQLYGPKSPSTGYIRSVQAYHSGMITTTAIPCD